MSITRQDRQRIAQRFAQTRNPVATSWAPVPYRGMSGEQASAVVPGGWFGGWLGVSPYWHLPKPKPPAPDGGRKMGVTDGTPPIPGEVGELVQLVGNVSFAGGAPTTASVTLGALSAGNWDCWAWGDNFSAPVTSLQFYLDPWPAGFSTRLEAVAGVGTGAEVITVLAPTCDALTDGARAIQFTVVVNTFSGGAGTLAGNVNIHFSARRVR